MTGRPLRVLLVYAAGGGNRTFSYQSGWPKHFARHPSFRCLSLNVLGPRPLVHARAEIALRRRFDAVVALHSSFSNEQNLGGRLLERIGSLSQPKAWFVGNEYKLMPEKIAFAERLGVALLVSQLHDPKAHDLYRERLRCEVAAIPSGGLDKELFAPRTQWAGRSVDIGYRAQESPLYLGHAERRELAERVAVAAARHGLAADISLDPADRFDERGWAAFLDRCRAQLGSEAGGDFFELTDATRHRVNAYLEERPEATIDEVRARFFAELPTVSGRALSGRIVEAAGTKTVQILLEGEYGGYFQPDVHYIPLRKDFANVDEALGGLRDEAECRRLADAAYEVASAELTYERLIGRFHAALAALL